MMMAADLKRPEAHVDVFPIDVADGGVAPSLPFFCDLVWPERAPKSALVGR
jgi:hypothetical protein